MPDDWSVAELEAVATFSSGTTPSRARQADYFENGVHSWVKTLDLNNSVVRAVDEKITDLALAETGIKIHPVGSVLVAMYGGFQQIGRTGLLGIAAAVNQAITVVKPVSSRLDSEYLLHLLNFRLPYWRTVASSSRKDPNITKSDVKGFPLLLPPVREQRRIAEALTDASELTSSLERLIAKKQAITQGMMQELLIGRTRLPGFQKPWRPLHIASCSTLKARIGWQGLTTAEYRVNGVYRLVGGTEFSDGSVDWQSTPFVDKWRYDQDSEVQVRAGDVLLTKDGTIGKTAYISRLPGPATLNSGVFVIRPRRDSYDSRFLYFMLRSRAFDEFLMRLTAGSTISHLYQRDLVGLILDVPPTTDEQQAIGRVLADADAEISSLRDRLAKARSMKQGMMQELLTGRRRLPVLEAAS
jgi:type I restriction enzyme S subunit